MEADRAPLALLIDGHNMIFRAFSSVPRSIVDRDGEPVNGVYGLIGTILRLITDRQPVYLVVAFDVPEVPTYRHHLYPAHQGKRGPLSGDMADNFARQVEQAKRVLDQIGLRWLVAPRFEADDIIATLARAAAAIEVPSMIVSNDRDLQQLVGPLVRVLIPGSKSLLIGPSEVQDRLGVPPERIVDWKVLAGDPSDNIPGVPGIGVKSAVTLVTEFGSWESVYEQLDQVPARQRQALEAGYESAKLFEDVVRLHTDLELDVEIEDLRVDYTRLPERAGDALRDTGLR